MTRIDRWVAFVERRHRRILLLSLAVTVLSVLSLTRLRLDIDVLNMLPTGSPAFDNFKVYVSELGELDELLILIEGDAPDTLTTFADAFVDRLRALSDVTGVQGRIEQTQILDGLLERYYPIYLPLAVYERLATDLTGDAIRARVRGIRQALQAPLDLSAAQWVRRDPLGLKRLAVDELRSTLGERRVGWQDGFLSTLDGKALLLLVRPTGSAFDIPFTTRLMAAVREAERSARTAVRSSDAVRVGYTGSYAFALEDAGTIKSDVARYSLLALAGVLMVFLAGYRNLRILPFVTYPLLLGTLLTFVAGLVLYDELNAVSLCFAAILYGLSIDSAIHYYTRLLQEHGGVELRDAVRVTLRELGSANVLASSTTAAAFLVIGFSQLAGISQLGVLTAAGMLINIAMFFVIYPALTFWMEPRTLGDGIENTPRLGALAGAAARRARRVLLLATAVCVALAVVASEVRFDVDLQRLRPAATEASRVEARLVDRFGADAGGAALLVRATNVGRALEDSTAVWERVLQQRDHGRIAAARSILSLLPSESVQRERWERYLQLPRQRIAADLAAALQENGFRTDAFATTLTALRQPAPAILQPGDPLLEPLAAVVERYVRTDGDRATVATYLDLPAGMSPPDLFTQLQGDLPQVELIPASRAWLEEELGHMLRRETIGFCAAAFALNLILVLVNFRSVGLAVAVLVPEALVILAFLAMLRVSDAGIDPVNLIVVPLILGIGVDNCVYIVERLRHGATIEEALRRGGRALVVAALTTMAGFGFLGLSRYPALARMGELAAISLLLCLVGALVLLPALLVRLGMAGVEEHRER